MASVGGIQLGAPAAMRSTWYKMDMKMTKTHVIRMFYRKQDGVDIDDPSLTEVMNAVMALDGHDSDSMSVTLGNGDSMDIGGGAANQYKCHARTKNSFFHLVDSAVPKEMANKVKIQMDEEITTYPDCCIVSLDMVKTAVEFFCVNGELSPDLSWDNTLAFEPL